MQREITLPDEVIFIPNTEQSDIFSLSLLNWSNNHINILVQLILENIKLKAELNDMHRKYGELEAKNNELELENKELKAENQKLFEQSHLDCTTSGIPSSKDWKGNDISDTSEKPENTIGSNDDVVQEEKGIKETPTSIKDYIVKM